MLSFPVLLPSLVVLCASVAAAASSPQYDYAWQCDAPNESSLPKGPAKSVYNLHPSQVDVVLALGDSVTAAFGVNGRKGGLHEFRGKSWSMGGDANATTLPNFIKRYNPNLKGYSVGQHEVRLCWGKVCRDIHTPKKDRLNAALSGSMINNVVDDELDYLMEQLEGLDVDIQQSWKVLTLFVGANDLCLACHDAFNLGGTYWEGNLRKILDTVRDRIPRVLVNVVQLFNMSRIYDLSESSPYCHDVHRSLFIECDCAFGPEAKYYRGRMDELAQLYNKVNREVASSYMKTRNETFAIALHTFTEDMDIAQMPIEMLSSLDCFHPSEMSHAFSATSLWNSMLTPPNDRTKTTPLDVLPKCIQSDSVFHPGIPNQ